MNQTLLYDICPVELFSMGLFFLFKLYTLLNEYLFILTIDYALKKMYNTIIETNKQTLKGGTQYV